jgi:transposase
MRKGFDGLCAALVTQGLHRNPLDGDVFLFVSRDRVRAKTIHWDGTGLCVYAKRLERGRFARLWRDAGDDPSRSRLASLISFSRGVRWWVASHSRHQPSRILCLHRITGDDQMHRAWWS